MTLEYAVGEVNRLDRELRSERRRNRKLVERVNRLTKLIPGRQRIWRLQEVVMEFDYLVSDSDTDAPEAEKWKELSLYVERLEYDLNTLNQVKNGDPQPNRKKYDPTQWPRGPRP
jgi:hypothetical protein